MAARGIRRMRGLMILGLVASLVVGGAVSASADDATVTDDREWGKDGRFDIARASHGHGRARPYRPARLKHSVEFHKAFKGREYKRRGSLWLRFPGKDRAIFVEFKKGEYRGEMRSSDGLVGRPRVWKSSPDTISLSFPRRWLKRGLKRYQWRAFAEWFAPCNDNGGGPATTAASASSCVALIDETAKMTHRV